MKMIRLPLYSKHESIAYLGNHWSNRKMPMLYTEYTRRKGYPNAKFRSPSLLIKYAHLSPQGNTHVADAKHALFTIDALVNSDDTNKVEMSKFHAWLKKKVDHLLEVAWSSPGFDRHKRPKKSLSKMRR